MEEADEENEDVRKIESRRKWKRASKQITQRKGLGSVVDEALADLKAVDEPRIGKPIGRVVKAKTIYEKQFKVYRDDETDIFKPHSSEAIDFLASQPLSNQLTPDEKSLLNAVASDLQRSFSLENILGDEPKDDIPEDAQLEIDKLPTWLGPMIAHRYGKIKNYFKADTVKFLKNINLKINKEYRPEFAYFEAHVIVGDTLQYNDAQENKVMSDISTNNPETSLTANSSELPKTDADAVFLISKTIGKWKRTKENSKLWHPKLVHAVAKKMRHDLTLKPSTGDLVLTNQDVIHHRRSDSEDSDFDESGNPKWEVIKRREIGERDAALSVELDFARLPKGRPVPDYVDVVAVNMNQNRVVAKIKNLKKKQNEKGLGKVAIRRQLFTRGHFRDPLKLLTTGCGTKSMRPRRLQVHIRSDDNFHHYIVTMVGATWFRALIMIIILLNAVVLTVEPLESSKEYPLLWKIIDEILLATYVMEAILKIYAHPLAYWKSGFNVFDFAILVVSLVKIVNDWLDVADIGFLRVLLIVRALRILRGISLSIQLQVLVAALAQTIRTHVLSVVLLLVLLLYIASIVAYHLFGERNQMLANTWGFVPTGMLRMIVFVTMDGWTDILEEFEQSGLQTSGRIFNLVCIVLGNFMFSNIFIAIIILNISEATDLYRERMRREKQESVRRKKENVFRRQKLDMRQLLARQKKSATADFYHLGEQFLKLLRHDDMVKMTDICTSPLWIDAMYKTILRAHHTSVVLMNIHRLMADNLLSLSRLYDSGKMQIKTIRRGRYNRYMKIKAKLALLKREILALRNEPPKSKLHIRLPK